MSLYGHEAYLLSGEIPLRFDKMVFASEDSHIVLLNNWRVLSELDQLQVYCVRLV